MTKLRGKIQAYATARAQGLDPLSAGAQAGYSQAGLKVTVCRLEKRSDVKAEMRRQRRGGKPPADDTDEPAELDKWGMKDRYDSPLDLLKDVMNNPKAPKSLRYQAAKDALPYCHARKEGGKKEEAAERSKRVATKGRFQTTSRPSRLTVN